MSAVDAGGRAGLTTADEAGTDAEAPGGDDAGRGAARRTRLGWGLAVLALLAGSLALRVWGAKQGLPYAYNADENAHFVPKAIGLFGHGWNPDYFVNPPAYTYVLHVVFAVWFGGRAGVSEVFARDPTQVFLVARLVAAAFGTLSVWLLYLAGARLFADRRVGFLSAALLAVAFLPVFYSHLALNDVPTLAPICLSLYGTAGIVHGGRLRDYVLAGAGLGLACATKYTGGIALLPLVGAAAGALLLRGVPGARASAARGLVVAGICALVAFLIANPYALLDHVAFFDGLNHQSTVADDALGKLGLTEDNGLAYYLWTLTWGLGWVPAIGAAVGVVLVAKDSRRLAVVLVPGPVLFLVFMGTQARFFGRWLMPVFPMICLLAAYALLRIAIAVGRRRPVLAPTMLALAAILLCGQGLVASLHSGQVLSRADTRNMARDWFVAHVPPKTKVVVEPVVPDGWAQDIGRPSPLTQNGNRWVKYPTSRSNIANDGSQLPGPGRIVNIEDYERTLYPGLVDVYEKAGYCWVVVGSTQRGRAEVEPDSVPQALAYYRELERRADTAYVASPYRKGAGPVDFNFDWSFDFYPLAYHRPGPTMWIYHLRGGRCAGG
ncbi:glycosyltransferase family 39 protein [Baekduia soli]|uniref:Glycosyltransferase family 39 protein n=1 Tax=Baekduia soli TaxID=496014 RepID=A0A5B8U721_9ACTN|nr:glycosyltransferase family 39 protein [Baekduia soli]QEC48648.1 glycosyltransferase family 39 protein [Baekduia soli]